MTDAKLKSYVERIDRVMTSMDEARADIAKIIKDAKGDGYIPKTLRKVATRYHADPSKIATEDALLETYEAALGRVGKAMAAVRAGATWNDAAKDAGVGRATVARAMVVSIHREMIPTPRDPITGEVTEAASSGDDAGHRSEPSAPAEQSVYSVPSSGPVEADIQDGEGEQSGTHSVEQGDRQSPLRDGGAPVETSTVGPAVTTPRAGFAALSEPRAQDDLAIPTFLRRTA